MSCPGVQIAPLPPEICYSLLKNPQVPIATLRPPNKINNNYKNLLIKLKHFNLFSTSHPQINPKTLQLRIIRNHQGQKRRVSHRDIELKRLFIPVEQALDHFPPLANRQNTYAETITLSDAQNHHVSTTIGYDILQCVFVENKWWKDLVKWHNWKGWGVIRFYRPVYPSQDNHYLVDFVERDEQITSILEFKPENFLFQLKVTFMSNFILLLVVPIEAVRNHFPAVGIPAETHNKERLYLTDAQNRNWCIEIIADTSPNLIYMLAFKEAFLNEHNLEQGDVIRFYKPVQPLCLRHFLFESERRENLDGLSSISSESDTDDETDSDVFTLSGIRKSLNKARQEKLKT